ncbi:MAG: urease accessory protein UreD [Rhodoferax sp.]|uniref:urease accessory protein UreD n=1 Tax=Rhodoferax sp. TaxID=50421 RepID=UPI00271B266E|nr:urease accessory protein UreD [Rhodoferax sp.]MDO8448787.1 urease accessory protein UreD [Rhodoferax sp.]
MAWHASLQLDYALRAGRTVAQFRHDGPLRVLQSLYPEGDAVCHSVLVHPPGGLVGGDTLDLRITASDASHGLITTPGATRFYRSSGEPALQRTHITLTEQARLEWLPLETICYNNCLAENHLTLDLAPQAEFLGWDVTALGLPHAHQPFDQGSFLQHIEVPGVWLERGRIQADDHRLMNGPLGLAGHRCLASIFFVAGSRIERARRQGALDLARAVIEAHDLRHTAGATSPDGQVIVVRVLAPMVEPAMDLLRRVWAGWRQHLWTLSAASPRIWST